MNIKNAWIVINEIAKWKSKMLNNYDFKMSDIERIKNSGIVKTPAQLISGIERGTDNILKKYDIKSEVQSPEEIGSHRLGYYDMINNTITVPPSDSPYSTSTRRHEAGEGEAGNRILNKYYKKYGEYPFNIDSNSLFNKHLSPAKSLYSDDVRRKYGKNSLEYKSLFNTYKTDIDMDKDTYRRYNLLTYPDNELDDVIHAEKNDDGTKFTNRISPLRYPKTHIAPSVIKHERDIAKFTDYFKHLDPKDENDIDQKKLSDFNHYVDAVRKYHTPISQYDHLNNLDPKMIRKFEKDRLRKLKRISDINKKISFLKLVKQKHRPVEDIILRPLDTIKSRRNNYDKIYQRLEDEINQLKTQKINIVKDFSDKWESKHSKEQYTR